MPPEEWVLGTIIQGMIQINLMYVRGKQEAWSERLMWLWTGEGFAPFLSVVSFFTFVGLSPGSCRTSLSEIWVFNVDEKQGELWGETLAFEHLPWNTEIGCLEQSQIIPHWTSWQHQEADHGFGQLKGLGDLSGFFPANAVEFFPLKLESYDICLQVEWRTLSGVFSGEDKKLTWACSMVTCIWVSH